jgi:hypothetical protein
MESYTPDLSNLREAVDEAIANFVGHDEYDEETVDVVQDQIYFNVKQYLDEKISYGDLLLFIEATTTYVQADLSEDELDQYVAGMVDSLEEWGVL